jgi:hypothetical protein
MTDIQVGHRYTDGKGQIREVVARGPQFVLFRGQQDTDCLRYRLVAQASRSYSTFKVGEEYNCTVRSFAAWVKEEVYGCLF